MGSLDFTLIVPDVRIVLIQHLMDFDGTQFSSDHLLAEVRRLLLILRARRLPLTRILTTICTMIFMDILWAICKAKAWIQPW